MQRLALAAVGAGVFSAVEGAFFRRRRAGDNAITEVTKLLTDLKTSIEKDGTDEQTAYDKYACWCEDTLARKAGEITDAKTSIDALQSNIVKLGGELASHAAEITQLKKDIAANIESQQAATTIRDKEYAAYEAEKGQSEQCIGALEAAIKVLEGAGTKKGFLETLQEAQLFSVIAGVRGVLARKTVAHSVSGQDLDIVRRFVDHPDQFVGGSTGFLSAAQIRKNPYGDYAPQSAQVSGVLKGMYDSFMADLEKANGEEAKAQETFESLMATKKAELKTLQDSLQSNELDEATKTKQRADDKTLLDDTVAQLSADEELFAQTKTTCKAKASEWAERSQLRTEELAGINEAIAILNDPENKKIFDSATSSFLQLSSERAAGSHGQDREGAYAKLARLAKKTQSLALARVAVQLKNGGHFDQIMVVIDKMVEDLREEEQEDIDHKNRCENSIGKNKMDTEDLNHAIDKDQKAIDRLGTEQGELRDSIKGIEDKIAATQKDLDDAKKMRNDEVEAFRKGVKDDTDAIALIEEAIKALDRFYTAPTVPGLVQTRQDPAYDPDKPPSEPWTDVYKGKHGEGKGVIAILEMIKEDLEKEIKTARKDDGEAQAMYEKDSASMRDALQKQIATKVATEKEIAAMEAKIGDLDEDKTAKGEDLNAENDRKAALDKDCGWIDTHFESRRTKRKAEIDGLIEAKGYLAGVESGDEI